MYRCDACAVLSRSNPRSRCSTGVPRCLEARPSLTYSFVQPTVSLPAPTTALVEGAALHVELGEQVLRRLVALVHDRVVDVLNDLRLGESVVREHGGAQQRGDRVTTQRIQAAAAILRGREQRDARIERIRIAHDAEDRVEVVGGLVT